MPYVSTDASEVYYESHGEGPVVMFAHGGGGHHAIWWQQIPHFRDRHRVIALDWPGFGLSRSKTGEYDIADYPDCLLAVLDDAGVDKAVIVAQSLGCIPAMRFAIDHPERVASVVLNHQVGGIKDKEIREMAAADRAEQIKVSVIDRLMTKEFQEENPVMIFLFQQMSTFNPVELRDIRNVGGGVSSLAEIKAAIATGTNVTYVQGGRDKGTSHATYDRLRELLPEADYVYLADAAHSPYWERPELFNATLDAILEKVLQSH